MTPYFVIFTLLAVFALIDAFDPPRRQKLFILLFCFVVLALFAGLRMGDRDYYNYVDGFREVERWGMNYSKLDMASYFEPGYNFTAWVTASLTHSPAALFLVVASIAVGLNLSSFKDYSRYFLIAVMLYFVHTFLLRDAMQIRAGVAAAVCLYSLRHVGSRSLAKFLITVAIAVSFHLASLFFVVVYWLYNMDWGRRVWIWIVAVCLAVAFVAPLGHLLTLLPGGGVMQRLLNYTWMVGSEESVGVLANPTILKQLFFVPLIVSLCWLLIWNDFPIVAGRIATFFSVTEVLVVPSFLYLFTPASRPVAALGIVAFAFTVLYLNVRPGANVLEYQNVLFTNN